MMSPGFQAAFTRLVTDLAFREAVQRGRLPADLTDDGERRHLAALATQPGLAAMRVVNRSFRLNKVLAMLPLTGRVLGEALLAEVLDRYWIETPSASFYYFQEAGRFCDHLWERIERGELDRPLLRDVLLYEQASIRLQQAATEGRELLLQVDFDHHPAFLEELSAGRAVPANVSPSPTAALGVARGGASIQWLVLDPTRPLPLFPVDVSEPHAGPSRP